MLRPFMEVISAYSGSCLLLPLRVDRPMERNVLIAIDNCKEAEHLLEERFGATGRGLHEKITSVEDLLPPRLTRILRRIATIRNKAVHERGSERGIDWEQFQRDSLWAFQEIKQLPAVVTAKLVPVAQQPQPRPNPVGDTLLFWGFCAFVLYLLFSRGCESENEAPSVAPPANGVPSSR